MTRDRYRQLMENDIFDLDKDEIDQGWHFCSEFDCLLVGPGMGELNCCRCLPKEHPVYKTAPPEDTTLMPGVFE